MMMIMILPRDYTINITLKTLSPMPQAAKRFKERVALYWILEPSERRMELAWSLETITQPLKSEVQTLNRHFRTNRIMVENNDIIVEDANQYAIDLGLNSVFNSPQNDEQFMCDIFVIMPFADEFEPVYEDHIKNVAENLGKCVKRGDDFFTGRSIMSDVWSAIFYSTLIIADCTTRNPNVFYELGIAHTLDKPVIMITQDIEDIPFDIRHLRVIVYEYSPRGMGRFEQSLRVAIEALSNVERN